MKHCRISGYNVYDLKYHIVWITKYRKPVLRGDVAERTKEICGLENVEIIKGHVSRDHVYVFVSVVLYISISGLVQLLKGKTSCKMVREYKN